MKGFVQSESSSLNATQISVKNFVLIFTGQMHWLQLYEKNLKAGIHRENQPGASQEFIANTNMDATLFNQYSQYQGNDEQQMTQSLNQLQGKYPGDPITLRTYQETVGPNRPTRDRNVKHLEGKNPAYEYTKNVNPNYGQSYAAKRGKNTRIGFIEPKSQVLLNEGKMTRKNIYHYQKIEARDRVHHASNEARLKHHDKYTFVGKERLNPKKEACPQIVKIHHNDVGRKAFEAGLRKDDSLQKTGDYLRTTSFKDGKFGF